MTKDIIKLINETKKWNYVAVDRTNGDVYQRNWGCEMGLGPLYVPIGKLDIKSVRELESTNKDQNLFFKDNFSESPNCDLEKYQEFFDRHF